MVTINTQKCIRSKGINCTNCVQVCPTHVIKIRDSFVKALRPEQCIACHCCKGSCPAGLETITVDDFPCMEKKLPFKLSTTSKALNIRIGEMQLSSPLILASGPLGRCAQGLYASSAAGLGAVVTKTITMKPREGNPSIRILPYGRSSIVSGEGLPNLGIHAMAKEIESLKLIDPNIVVVPSLSAETDAEFIIMAERMEAAGANALELALHGCRNVATASKATPARHWIENPSDTAKLIEAVRKIVKIPIWIKVNDYKETAIACQEAGADALIVRQRNSIAMPLDPDTGRPVMSHPLGQGVHTGPHTKLPGYNAVSEIAQCVSIPIIGNGGVEYAQDVINYIRSGATSVQLLTVLMRKSLLTVGKIIADLETYLMRNDFASIDNLRGQSLQYVSIKK